MLWEQGLTLGGQAWLTTATGAPAVPQPTVDEAPGHTHVRPVQPRWLLHTSLEEGYMWVQLLRKIAGNFPLK